MVSLVKVIWKNSLAGSHEPAGLTKGLNRILYTVEMRFGDAVRDPHDRAARVGFEASGTVSFRGNLPWDRPMPALWPQALELASFMVSCLLDSSDMKNSLPIAERKVRDHRWAVNEGLWRQ